jgi:hypothetical protein
VVCVFLFQSFYCFKIIKKAVTHCVRLDFFNVIKNYFAGAAAGAASAGAAAESTATAAVSATTAAESTTTAVVSAATASSAGASAFLHDTTVKTATTAKLKNTFFILLYYKRLIINSWQRYKFFNM